MDDSRQTPGLVGPVLRSFSVGGSHQKTPHSQSHIHRVPAQAHRNTITVPAEITTIIPSPDTFDGAAPPRQLATVYSPGNA